MARPASACSPSTRPRSGGASGGGPSQTIPIGTSVAEAERRLILATLDFCRGDKRRAADILGISLKTLYNRLNLYASVPAGN